MPFNLEAEQSVLGAILVDPERFNDIAGKLKENDFYLEEHREIYAAMQKLFLQSRDIDFVILSDTLVRDGVYRDKDHSLAYMKVIAETVPTASNIGDYAAIVKDNSLRRQIIEACESISEIAYRDGDSAESVLNLASDKISRLADVNVSGDFLHISQVLVDAYEHLSEISKNGASSGVMTGFQGLDNVLVGMGKGDLVIVGARPAMGKTSFVMNIATNVARQTKKAVGIFSLEMSAVQLALRMLSSTALVNSHKLRSGELTEEDWTKLADAFAYLSECDIYMSDGADKSVASMKAKLQRVKNLGLVVIDYLQLMETDNRGRRSDNKAQEVGDISRALKLMAKDLGVPVICCAQLNRGPERGRGESKRPTMSELRDSGAIEQDADMVLLLYRDDYYKDSKDPGAKNNIAEVIVAKNRHGETSTVEMAFNGEYTRFMSLSKTGNDPSAPPAPKSGGQGSAAPAGG